MEKIARCIDSGLECYFEALGESEEDVLELCIRHVQVVHGMDENPVALADRIISASRERIEREAGPYAWRGKAA